MFSFIHSISLSTFIEPLLRGLKSLPAMQERQETQAQSLCREDPRSEGMANPSVDLAGRISQTEEPGGAAKRQTRLK